MLLITRNMGESFFIGDVEVIIGGVNGFQVKVGIDAPKDVIILRSELYYKNYPDRKPVDYDKNQQLRQAGKDRRRIAAQDKNKNRAQALDNKGNK